MKRPYVAKSGFTIVEIIIVIIVIAVLSAITIVSYSQITTDAQNEGVKNDLQTVAGAIKKYKASAGGNPASLTAVDAKTTSGATFTYRRDYSTATFCLMGTLKSKTFYVEGDDRSVREGQCPIINIANNPSGESSSSGLSGYSSGVVSAPNVGSANAVSGTDVFQAVTNSTTNGQGGILVVTTKVAPSTRYTCSMSFKAGDTASVGQSVVFSGRGALPNGGYGGEGWGSQTVTLSAAWQRLNSSFTTPSSIGTLYVQFRLPTAASGITIQADALICTEGSTVYNYGDGSKSGWEWLGSTNLSASKGRPL
jgi:prepilin-type N-terminal cleavage/methylation domain-containing protein